MNPIGLVLPLARGNAGFFDQSYDSVTQIKSNIINLLRTNSGERRMQPSFSGGLQELLFSQNLSDSGDLVKKVIEDKIKAWIPGVRVENVELTTTDIEKSNLVDTYKVYVHVRFVVSGQTESVSVEFTPTSI